MNRHAAQRTARTHCCMSRRDYSTSFSLSHTPKVFIFLLLACLCDDCCLRHPRHATRCQTTLRYRAARGETHFKVSLYIGDEGSAFLEIQQQITIIIWKLSQRLGRFWIVYRSICNYIRSVPSTSTIQSGTSTFLIIRIHILLIKLISAAPYQS